MFVLWLCHSLTLYIVKDSHLSYHIAILNTSFLWTREKFSFSICFIDFIVLICIAHVSVHLHVCLD